MEFTALHGDKAPSLGLGTWMLEGTACRQAVTDALALGYRHIDTAQIYGNEAEVGDALHTSGVDRDQVFLTTKIWNDQHAAADVEASTLASLRRLRTDFVDLLLIHWPVEFDRVGETLAAMVALQERGLARHIGVSNFTVVQLGEAASLAPVACNQVEFHPYLDQRPLLEAATAAGVAVTAYSPLARGRVLGDDTLREIGERHGKTPAQVALRWVLDHPDVMTVPKASTRAHLEANLDVFDFSLSDGERSRIAGLSTADVRVVDVPWAPDWDH